MGHVAKIEIEGLADLTETLSRLLPREAQNLTQAAVRTMGSKLRKRIADTAPTRRKVLRKSFYVRNRRLDEGVAVTEVRARPAGFYWRFINFGTVKLSADAFVDRAVEEFRRELPKTMRDEVGKKLEAKLAKRRARGADV